MQSSENSTTNEEISIGVAGQLASDCADVNSEHARETLSKCDDGNESTIVESVPLDGLSELNTVPPEKKLAAAEALLIPKPQNAACPVSLEIPDLATQPNEEEPQR